MSVDLTRRQALVVVAASTAAACACCSEAVAQDGEKKKEEKPRPKSVKIGKLSDYDKPGFYDKFADAKVLVCKLEDRLVVMSAICTHKSCTLKPKADVATELYCKCHKGEYSSQGTPIAGPPKLPLVRYALTTAADGTITADLTKSFEEKKWDDKAAYIPISA